jgi:hypothetical protein
MTSLEPDLGAISSWRNGLLLALLVWLLTWLLYSQTFNSTMTPTDFHQVFSGGNGQVYPPPLALALRPLAKLPLDAAVHLWFFICVVSLLLSVGLFAKAAGIQLHDAAPLGIMLIVGFHFRPTALDFWQGQFVMPVLTLLCAAYLADSRDRPYSLAACIAVAAMIKPWMLGLLIYPLIRRKPLAFFWGLSLFAGVVGLFLVRQGWGNWFSLPRAMGRLFIMDLPSGFQNQSILGFAQAHFAPNAGSPWMENPQAIYLFVAGGFVVLSLGLGIASRRAPSARGNHARLLLGMTVVSLLLALPVCPRCNFVLLLPAIWTLLTIDAVSTAARGAAILAYAIFTRPFTGHEPPGWMSILPSAFFLAAVLLWVVLLASIRQRRRPTHAAAYFR